MHLIERFDRSRTPGLVLTDKNGNPRAGGTTPHRATKATKAIACNAAGTDEWAKPILKGRTTLKSVKQSAGGRLPA